MLDRNCKAFLASMPPLDATSTISPDRLVAFNNTNLALIHLHEHFAFPLDLTNVAEHLPSQRLTVAAGDIIRTAHQLVSTSYDFALCHPHNFICWAVASRVVAKERDRRRASDMDADVQDLELELNAIVAALNRGAAKSYKAERLVELVLRMKSGAYSESVLRSVARVCACRAGRSCRLCSPLPAISSTSIVCFPGRGDPLPRVHRPPSHPHGAEMPSPRASCRRTLVKQAVLGPSKQLHALPLVVVVCLPRSHPATAAHPSLLLHLKASRAVSRGRPCPSMLLPLSRRRRRGQGRAHSGPLLARLGPTTATIPTWKPIATHDASQGTVLRTCRHSHPPGPIPSLALTPAQAWKSARMAHQLAWWT